MTRRLLRLLLASLSVLAIVVAATIPTLLFDTSAAHADTSLIAWDAEADANTVDIVVDDAGGLAGTHPLSEIDVPEDTSEYETGPFGYGLASVLWPGAVAGNIGSLAGTLGLPSSLAAVAGDANDPVKAETFYPDGPATSTYPSGASSSGLIEMTSGSSATASWAKAGIADVSIPSLINIQDVQGSTSATATSMAISTAEGAFGSLSILGGLIQIGATTSTASAQSDGLNPSGTSTSNLGALTIAGEPVSVGSGGLVVGPASSDLSGILRLAPVTAAEQVMSLLDLTATPLPMTQTSTAPTEQITSAGLQLSFTLPSTIGLDLNCTGLPAALGELKVLCTVPDVLKGLTVTITIGRVTAMTQATQPFAIPTPNLSALSSLGAAGAGAGALGSTSYPSTSFTGSGAGSTPTSSGNGNTGTPARAHSYPLPTSLVSLNTPVSAGLLLLGLALAALVGLGLWRLTTDLAGASEHCPLEEDDV